MNELDRRIAELKGWKHHPAGTLQHKRKGKILGTLPEGFLEKSGAFHAPMNCDWSTSDAKAFELVDEMTGEFLFELESCADGIRWYANFNPIKSPFPGRGFLGMADSRPEAICRAYIVAVTWMREKKG